MTYKNTSLATKTFYGVTFKPGEVHKVSGYINDPKFIRVSETSETPSDSKVVKKVETVKPSTKTEKQGGKTSGTDTNK